MGEDVFKSLNEVKDLWVLLGVVYSHPLAQAPWVPTREEIIPYIIMLAKPTKSDVFYDLGCGDGRVVIEAALHGARGVCVEINPELIKKAKENAEKLKVSDQVVFINDDFFNVSIRDATIVYMYLLTSVNRALRPKLEKELRLGTRVITLDFEIPGWRPIHITRLSLGYREATLYLYVKGVSDI
ncbi:MAG: methyltransferase domain-containing protein [Sulfolobales archaeon]|nr:methyltransferase domain-containing protein [Sulfolobales archaeon]MDW8010395.1 methyltransferase domain-containing protein [Sulfolobales archaeon]